MPQRRQEEKHPSLILSTQAVRIRKEENMSSLWYKEPAKVWEEALPLGNGRIGAMIFGGVEQERIQVNEEVSGMVVRLIEIILMQKRI